MLASVPVNLLKQVQKKVDRFFCSISPLVLCPSVLTVDLSGGLCVSSYPLIFHGDTEDSYTHSYAKRQHIDLLSCLSVSVFTELSVWLTESLSFEMTKSEKTAHPP